MTLRRSVVLLLALCCLCAPLFGTITHDATSTASTCNTCSSLTFSATVNTGSNRVLVVPATTRDTTVTGVTFNGTAMTQAVSLFTATNLGCSIWYLVAPTQTSANVVITASGSSSNISGIGISLFGVDQANPVNDTGSTEVAAVTSVSISGLTTSINNAAIIDAMMTNNGPNVVSMQAETNRTQSMLQNVGPSADDQAGASRLINLATAGSPTLQWNLDAGGGNAALCGAAFAPATSGTNITTIFGKPQRAIQ